MKRRFLVGILAAAALTGAATDAAAPPAPAVAGQGDWTRTITRTPEGGMRMGNPEAPVKLVEYASITCPHCAASAAERGDALVSNFVRSGRVSWEYRPFMIFPTDPAVFQLLMCGDDQGFFQRVDELYASQETWSGRIADLSEQEREAIDARIGSDHSVAIIWAAGLDRFFLANGYDDMDITGCLADEAALDQLWQRNEQAAARDGVQGTPSFLINGELLNAIEWDEIESALRSALEPDT